MWPTMNRQYPQDDSAESAEGTAAHEVFARMFVSDYMLDGATASNGVVVTQEMVEGALLFVDTVYGRSNGAHLHIEKRTQIPDVHPECFGTPDAWAYIPQTGTLEIFDYKFGHGFVDEVENWQCLAYACGIIQQLSESLNIPYGMLDQSLRINITIVQPRCYHRGAPVRTWSTTGVDLRNYVNKLAGAAEAAMMPNPTATTNPECRHCPGRHACATLQWAAYSDAEFSGQSAPVELSPNAAALELRMLERAAERLGARVDGLREAVIGHIKRGAAVQHYRLEQGYGRQQWSVPAEQVVAMGQLMGVDLSKPGVVTPSQAAKLGVDESVISGYSKTPLGQIKLVIENPADAARVFGNN